MIPFYVYDITFMILFSLFIALFLWKRRRNVTREMGIAFLYKTQFGVNAIGKFAKKYSKILRGMKWVVITTGFLLMGSILWLIGKSFYIYAKFPQITEIVKAPPIVPLIPYFPKLFGMESFFPPLYFTYFILALAIVAIVHEFSHGIFMRLFNIRIKSTGFVFFGPLLGAFVEQDQKDMEEKKKGEQMAVLAAGTFANLLFALLFWGLLIGFFYLSFSAAGTQFATYSQVVVPVGAITGFGNMSDSFTEVYSANQTYILDDSLKAQLEMEGAEVILAYHDAPAIRNDLESIIIKIDDRIIRERDDLAEYLEDKKAGETIEITTLTENGEEIIKEIVLGKHPLDEGRGYLGIGFSPDKKPGFVASFISVFMGFKKNSTYYEPKWDGGFVIFIYNLLWWIMIINLLVALFNMMPLSILDGGQFFYLAILSVTGSKKIARVFFKIFTYAILFLFLMLMIFWAGRVF